MNDKNINLKLARVAKDLSQDQLAEKVEASRQTINLIETGKYNPTIELCLRICWALDKSLDELFWKNKEESNNAN
jgi:putative transcriptional regulator